MTHTQKQKLEKVRKRLNKHIFFNGKNIYAFHTAVGFLGTSGCVHATLETALDGISKLVIQGSVYPYCYRICRTFHFLGLSVSPSQLELCSVSWFVYTVFLNACQTL